MVIVSFLILQPFAFLSKISNCVVSNMTPYRHYCMISGQSFQPFSPYDADDCRPRAYSSRRGATPHSAGVPKNHLNPKAFPPEHDIGLVEEKHSEPEEALSALLAPEPLSLSSSKSLYSSSCYIPGLAKSLNRNHPRLLRDEIMRKSLKETSKEMQRLPSSPKPS